MPSQQRIEPAAVHAAIVHSMAEGMAVLGAIESAALSENKAVTTRYDLDLLTATVDLPAPAVVSLVRRLREVAKLRHRVVVHLSEGGSALSVRWEETGRASIDLEGSARDFVAPAVATQLEDACTRGDDGTALGLLPHIECGVELTLRPAEAGGHWVRGVGDLATRLRAGGWASTLLRLTSAASKPAVVVVQDAGHSVLTSAALILAGPDAMSATLMGPEDDPSRSSSSYRSVRVRSGVADLPDPRSLLSGDVPTGGPLQPAEQALKSAAQACCWYWLSRTSVVSVDRTDIHFDGVRAVDLELRPLDASSPNDVVDLFAWATSSADPMRDDSVQQAITFAVRDAADLDGAAGPVLRTARSLYELAGRGAVAEALAARRAAREAAIAAARSAASTAHEVSTKAVERTLALLVAAAVAVYAHAHESLSLAAAITVIVLTAALAILALGVSDWIEIESASQMLRAFDEDAAELREALSSDDIESIKGLAALGASRADLKRARRVVRGIYIGLACLVLLGGGLSLALHHHTRPLAPQSHPVRMPTSHSTPSVRSSLRPIRPSTRPTS